ncbi:MAG: hypothetical protein IJA72_00135, partial [Clostridia bacterium]|nr:hypothetical protein [Clostridia bacterium]
MSIKDIFLQIFKHNKQQVNYKQYTLPDNKLIQLINDNSGWAVLSMKAESNDVIGCDISYTTNVAFDIINFFIQAIEDEKNKYSVSFDGEPTTYTLTAQNGKVIYRKDYSKKITLQGSALELAKQVLEDINTNVEGWATFHYSNNP